MKNYRVTYSGNATRFKNFSEEVFADNAREAVEQVYSERMDDNYFPQEDGSIRDCDGHEIADSSDEYIEYDGGYFSAEEIEDEPEIITVNKDDYEIFAFSSGYFGITEKGKHGGNCVHGGDSANDDDYDRDYMEAIYEEWDGTLHYSGEKYGYTVTK